MPLLTQTTKSPTRFLVGSLAIVTAIGCGDDRGLAPVSGTVTIDGEPLTIGQVMISPPGRRQCVGPLDAEGHFQLSSYKPGDGAPLGTFPVAVMAVEQVGERELRWHAPRRYANERESGLQVTIDGATDDLQIELTWDGSKSKGPFVERF